MRQIARIISTLEREAHIWEKHRVTRDEVEEACFNEPLVVRGREGCHVVLGQTEAGRYLHVVVVLMNRGRARLITARDVTPQERRYYQRRGK